MPIYEYGCHECGKHIEAFQKISDKPLTVCPDCGGKLSKLMSLDLEGCKVTAEAGYREKVSRSLRWVGWTEL